MATTFFISSTSNPASGPPASSGDTVHQALPAGITVNTTASGTNPLNVVGDFLVLFEVADGAKLHGAQIKVDDLDTSGGPSLDLDLVLRLPDDNGDAAVADVVLFNGGTSFQSAFDDFLYFNNRFVQGRDAADRRGWVGLKVVAAAATGVAAGAIDMVISHT